MSALLPCPFCGGAPERIKYRNGKDGYDEIVCPACACGTPRMVVAVHSVNEGDSPDAAWNRRALAAPSSAGVSLTGWQLLQALQVVGGEGSIPPDEGETSITIRYAQHELSEGQEELIAELTEYPEEGCVPITTVGWDACRAEPTPVAGAGVRVPDAISQIFHDSEYYRGIADGHNSCRAEVLRLNATGADAISMPRSVVEAAAHDLYKLDGDSAKCKACGARAPIKNWRAPVHLTTDQIERDEDCFAEAARRAIQDATPPADGVKGEGDGA